MLTHHEMRAFKTLFGKYCKQEVSLGHCEPDACKFCPVNMAYSEIFERFAGGEPSCVMRLPTCAECNALAEATGGDNGIMHWEKMYSWCQDADPDCASHRAVRGWVPARYWDYYYATYRSVHVGFRPAFEALNPDTLGSDGAIVVGTLYMEGQPVRVPQNPTRDGDIQDYIPGACLELREALGDPAYQVHAIKVGDILIADRVLLKRISWNDLAAQGIC